MRVGLFVPCYVDQFYPGAAIATLQLLEKLGVEVVYPKNQTCCGQPMANSGFEHLTDGCNRLFIDNFSGFDYIVSPSGSCVLHIREHLYDEKRPAEAKEISHKVWELTSFLTDILSKKPACSLSAHGRRTSKLPWSAWFAFKFDDRIGSA